MTETNLECLKKVGVVALGTFIGFYAALSLFAATHKPPMMKYHNYKARPGVHYNYKRMDHQNMRKDFSREGDKIRRLEKRGDFQQRPQVPQGHKPVKPVQ